MSILETGYNKEDNPIINNALVRAIILSDIEVSPLAEKAIEALNNENKENADLLGIPFEPIENSYHYGISYKVGILEVHNGNNIIKVLDNEVIPNYRAITNIQIIHPELMFKRKMNYWRQGYGEKLIKGKYSLIDLFPSALVSKDWDTGETASDYTTNEQLKHKEKERKIRWKSVINYFEQLDETQLIEKYKILLCSIYGIGKIEGHHLVFDNLRPGVIFQAAIDKKQNSYYFSLKGFEFINRKPVYYREDSSYDESLMENINNKLRAKNESEQGEDEVPF